MTGHNLTCCSQASDANVINIKISWSEENEKKINRGTGTSVGEVLILVLASPYKDGPWLALCFIEEKGVEVLL